MVKRKAAPQYDKGWKSFLDRDEKAELALLEARIDEAEDAVAKATEKRKALIIERHVLQNRATARRRRGV